jgi:flagellar assembly protein FliH
MPISLSRILQTEEHSGITPIQWPTSGAAPEADSPSSRDRDSAGAGGRPNPQLETAHRAELERTNREHYQLGFAEGQAAGQKQAAANLRPLEEHLAKSLSDLTALRGNIRKGAEKDLIKLAIAISRRLLHRELTLDPASIEGLIRVALEKIQSRELCRVRVHPDHKAAVAAGLERLANSRNVEIIADTSLQFGDVLFETAHGDLDASIETQLREIERGFADRLNR